MENLKSDKSRVDDNENVRVKCSRCSYWSNEDLSSSENLNKTKIIHGICLGAAFLFFICAFLYCYLTLCYLTYQIEILKLEISTDEKTYMFPMERRNDDLKRRLLTFGVAEYTEKNKMNNPLKRKRREDLTPMDSILSDENLSEGSVIMESSHPTRRIRRDGVKKSKKYHRHEITEEKILTEIESTTAIPIQQTRQSKQTAQVYNLRKNKRVVENKPLLQVYGSKEFITLEEALLRPGTLRNVKSENTIQSGKRINSGSFAPLNASVSKEPAEAVHYNMIMIHYAADTSHYSKDLHSNYCGNGRLQMKESVYKDWKAAHSTQGVNISKYFSLNPDGKVVVSVTGIYLIYAQVQYSNVQEVNGYEVIRNKQTVVQCITTSIHPDKHEIKSNTCDTSTTILLSAGDNIFLQDLHHGRHVVLKPEKSYFGLILLSPFKEIKKLL